MLLGVDALALALLIVALARPAAPLWLLWSVAVAFGVVYMVGRHRVPVVSEGMSRRGQWWPGGAWAVALIACFVGLLLVSTGAMWLAFPLVLLELHVLGTRVGLIAVGLTTALAILLGAVARGTFDVGVVVGPIVGAAVAVGIVLALEALSRVVADKDEALEDLRTTREALAASESERAVAGERTRLARDIHDTLAQDFSAIGLQLRAVEARLDPDSDGGIALRAAQRTAADGLAEARRFVAELSTGEAEAGLESALRRVVAKAAVTGGPDITLSVQGESRQLPTEAATTIIRVTQSALANVVQHAGARAAEVVVTYDEHSIVLDVVDDGTGFDVADGTGQGFGLGAMRDRAAELGGTLTIDSDSDGTAVSLSLPLAAVPA